MRYFNYYSPRSGYWRVEIEKCQGGHRYLVSDQSGREVSRGVSSTPVKAKIDAEKVLKSHEVRVDS